MSNPIRIVCPRCGVSLKAEEVPAAAKQARCPRCDARFSMPLPLPAVAAGHAPSKVPVAVAAGPSPATWPNHGQHAWMLFLLVPVVVVGVLGLGTLGVLVWKWAWPGDTAQPSPLVKQDETKSEPAKAPIALTKEPDVASRVRAIFATNCFRCHGQDDDAEAGVYILERDKLVADKKVVPGDPDNSRLYQRVTNPKRPMPPEEETPRPSTDDIALIKQWIAAGAPSFTSAPPIAAGAQLDASYFLTAMRDYLLKLPETDRKYQRFFTLVHLANNPAENANLPIYQAALAKLVNSASWKKDIAHLTPVDAAETILALDLRKVDWETPDRWVELVRAYPYGLRYDSRASAALRPLVEEVEHFSGSPLPYVRGDWFIATASRPPLYNVLLALPPNAKQLEQLVGVDIAADFLNGKLRRSGFLKSNVSSQNRLIERHDSRFGAYWRSYDFKSSQNKESLIGFPLGPTSLFIPNHPFPNQAFEQAGGEIIFNLPNGLQGYMLVDGKDNRIEIAPIEVVRDKEETAGTPQIVNGLSCMACHVNGMIIADNMHDVIRTGSAVEGPARTFVEELYVQPSEMDQSLKKDADRFGRAMKRTLEGIKATSVDEPISAVARPFIRKGVDLKTAAYELGVADPQVLQQAILTNRTLRLLGLEPLTLGNAIQRASWEQIQSNNRSLFQQVADELGLGTPVR